MKRFNSKTIVQQCYSYYITDGIIVLIQQILLLGWRVGRGGGTTLIELPHIWVNDTSRYLKYLVVKLLCDLDGTNVEQSKVKPFSQCAKAEKPIATWLFIYSKHLQSFESCCYFYLFPLLCIRNRKLLFPRERCPSS